MEPRIQYVRTEDSVNLAVAMAGEGPPLLYLADLPGSHVQREWRLPVYRDLFERIASRHTLVRFDPRGLGLSDRDVHGFSFDRRVSDLEEVVERLDLERFTLFGDLNSGAI